MTNGREKTTKNGTKTRTKSTDSITLITLKIFKSHEADDQEFKDTKTDLNDQFSIDSKYGSNILVVPKVGHFEVDVTSGQDDKVDKRPYKTAPRHKDSESTPSPDGSDKSKKRRLKTIKIDLKSSPSRKSPEDSLSKSKKRHLKTMRVNLKSPPKISTSKKHHKTPKSQSNNMRTMDFIKQLDKLTRIFHSKEDVRQKESSFQSALADLKTNRSDLSKAGINAFKSAPNREPTDPKAKKDKAKHKNDKKKTDKKSKPETSDSLSRGRMKNRESSTSLKKNSESSMSLSNKKKNKDHLKSSLNVVTASSLRLKAVSNTTIGKVASKSPAPVAPHSASKSKSKKKKNGKQNHIKNDDDSCNDSSKSDKKSRKETYDK